MPEQSREVNTIVNRSMPPGIIIPELVYPDLAAAVTWLCTIFGFTKRLRIGDHRAQLVLHGMAAMVAVQGTNLASQEDDVEAQSSRDAITHALMVRVDDLQQHYERVSRCGARIIQPPTVFPYGERQYTVEDLAGHRWTFTESVADVDPNDWGGILREDTTAPV